MAGVKFIDSLRPVLPAGQYRITAGVSAPEATEDVSVQQRFDVVAPQFSLAPDEITQYYPPPGGAGQYGNILPFVTLARPALPWERTMPSDGPWLALVVFQDGEVNRPITTTIGDFLALRDVRKPSVTMDIGTSHEESCSYLEVPADLFRRVFPKPEHTPYLAHVREIDDGPTAGVVVANRFPEPGKQATSYLVSLDGLTDLLADSTASDQPVAVITLAAWSFGVTDARAEEFSGLALDLVDGCKDFMLRLSMPQDGDAAVISRLRNGFVPITYHARTGEETLAWYRGPITPVRTAPLALDKGFRTADAAMIYDVRHGVFDLSLSSAWQIGRASALADTAFCESLLSYRRAVHKMADLLLDRYIRDHFPVPEELARLARPGALVEATLDVLSSFVDILSRDRNAEPEHDPVRVDADPQDELTGALDDPRIVAALQELVFDELMPVLVWLERLVELRQIPYEHLVPVDRMLPLMPRKPGDRPRGSVRFGYLDTAWVSAAIHGALSLGLESSRHVMLAERTARMLLSPIYQAIDSKSVITAMLLRSPLVSGWPTLEVTAFALSGDTVPIMRSDRVAPGVLLCLFAKMPTRIRISEPSDGLRMGADMDGRITVDASTRIEVVSGADRVLDPVGVGAEIGGDIGPARFAAYFLRRAQEITFTTGTAS